MDPPVAGAQPRQALRQPLVRAVRAVADEEAEAEVRGVLLEPRQVREVAVEVPRRLLDRREDEDAFAGDGTA
jgi:hypothetical protein